MVTRSIEPTTLSSVEALLVAGEPFGSYDYIAEKLTAAYLQLLSQLAEESPAARIFLAALAAADDTARRAALRDPLTRRTIEDGVCTLHGVEVIKPAMLDGLLTAAAENIGTTGRTLLDTAVDCLPLATPFTHPASYIWTDDQPRTSAGKRFVGEALKRLPGFRIRTPTSDQIETLELGAGLAHRVFPELAGSALPHTFMVLVGEFAGQEDAFNALTVPGLPGVLVMAPKAFSNSANVAETLIHEALHLKFMDIEYANPLFAVGYRHETSPRVRPIWHEGGPEYDDWSIDRLLTSMHVYVALTVMFESASAQESVDLRGPEHCRERAEECRTRADWLFGEAQNHLDVLTDDGREFVSSIGVMLRNLRPNWSEDR